MNKAKTIMVRWTVPPKGLQVILNRGRAMKRVVPFEKELIFVSSAKFKKKTAYRPDMPSHRRSFVLNRETK
jgi:hypothetical protein